MATGRRRIVECGSGISTVLVARLLRDRGGGTLHALEHDPGWAESARGRLAAEGLDGWARVIEAPLQPDPLAQPGCEWYSSGALDQLPEAGVDLLLVDGPPASPESGLERSRYPALPRLAGRLAADATVILDNAERAGERWVFERWQRELGARFDRNRGVATTALSRVALVRGRAGHIQRDWKSGDYSNSNCSTTHLQKTQ